jgi:hypothetical protein
MASGGVKTRAPGSLKIAKHQLQRTIIGPSLFGEDVATTELIDFSTCSFAK